MNLYIVTGASRGLGAALARRIAADPANELVAIARGEMPAPPRGLAVRADLADAAALARACERIDSHLAGRAWEKAVLVNNAGVVAPVGPLAEVDPVELARSLAVNLAAPMVLMRWFLGATTGVATRRIVNISSGAGRRPISGWSAYCAAKAGLDMATRVAALECAGRSPGAEVVSLAPGVIDTDMQSEVRAAPEARFADVERFRAMKAQGVLRPADDVAADILRLEAEGRLSGEALLDLRELA